jgi:N-succinyldiaminopimelate aminotransferase
VLVTAGATEAIAGAIFGLCQPGDEVVTLEPHYDSYVAMIQIAGGVRRPVTLRAPDFRLDLDELAAAISPRTRLILLNTPHNPTGAVLTREELQAVADLAVEHDLLVVTDEVYEHLVFDGRDHVPLCTLPGMAERTVTISSHGKTFSFTGWKIGWATGPAPLVAAVRAAKQFLTYAGGTPFQHAAAVALRLPDSYYTQAAAALAERRDRLCAGLAEAGFEVFRPEGTYFTTVEAAALGATDGLDFCLSLPERAGVVAVPTSVFYDDPESAAAGGAATLVRFAFCKRLEVLDAAVARLKELSRA